MNQSGPIWRDEHLHAADLAPISNTIESELQRRMVDPAEAEGLLDELQNTDLGIVQDKVLAAGWSSLLISLGSGQALVCVLTCTSRRSPMRSSPSLVSGEMLPVCRNTECIALGWKFAVVVPSRLYP